MSIVVCSAIQLSVYRCATSSFQSIAVPPRFSSTSKKDDGSKRPQWRGPDSVWLECGSSRQYHGMIVEIQSTEMVLLSRRHTTSSGLDESRHASTTSTSRVRVACFLNLGVLPSTTS
ncbi:hypothetical protein THAOC_14111 [Thalassiosira oceanica]|uniref:Uncharacterized protein n=1 Tax=Thalassiosira oceanica TaxID=159749 RepID=K0SI79_THAOC|nr:hypothetical protein THAOC_14111 [Thalassiosira oceanica]|eukprot:EJK65085.1 hypothetical protein THAOC_14111 [Thalassiosira oceanica]